MKKVAEKPLKIACLLGFVLAGPVLADGKTAKHGPHHAGKFVHVEGKGRAAHRGACPPGLAKKDPACVPPGLAKRAHAAGATFGGENHRDSLGFEIGDAVPVDAWVLIANPQSYGLRGENYLRYDGYVYRVDPDTRQVLAIVGLAEALLN